MTPAEIRAQLDDHQVLICTMFGEAAQEPIEGQIAVACVIRNRVKTDIHQDGKPDWWGEGYRGICLAKSQFTCWWEDHANTRRVYELGEALIRRLPLGETGILAQLRWIAEGIIGEQIRDNTKGANHYLTTKLWSSTAAPAWSRAKPVATIGHHTFFRL